MTGADFEVPRLFDYVATFIWASSGAVVGIQKRFDVIGVFVVALLSSTGGGLVRDAVLLERLPALLTDAVYLPLIAAVTTLVSLFAGRSARILNADTTGRLVALIDAAGIPAFAVIGMQLALERHIPLPGVVFVGVVNGVGGGLLRDVVVGDVPALLRPGQFTSLSLVLVCGLFLALTLRGGFNAVDSALATVAVFFFLRVLTVRFNWKTQAVLRELDDSISS